MGLRYRSVQMTPSAEGERFHRASLSARESAGGGLTRITVDPGHRVASTYKSPGQYTEIRVSGESGYFVLANEPGAAAWHLIMRRGGGVSDVLLATAPGASLEVTDAIGSGFPMDASRGRRLVIALGGTGVAAALPLVHRRMADGDATRTDVLIGLRSRNEVPIHAALDAWASAGVRVIACTSQDESATVAGTGEVRYARGYVQDALRLLAAESHNSLAGALVFAVGPDSMIDSLRELAPELGIPREDVLTNH
jgi:NAD(P)H-flavin reductase